MSARQALTAASVTVALAALAPAQQFKDALPADTMMFVSMPDISRSIEEMQDMPLAKIWREGEVQDFLADGLKMLETEWENGMAQARQAHEAGMLPFHPDDILKLRVESLSFAMTGLELARTNNDVAPNMGMLLHVDFGNSADTARKILSTAIEMGLQSAPPDRIESTQRELDGGIQLRTIAPPAETGIPMSLNIAFAGNGIVIGTRTAEVETFLGNLAGGKKVLTATSNYNAIASQVNLDGAEAESYFRLDRLLDFAMNVMNTAKEMEPDFPAELDPAGVDRAMTAFGLRSMKAIGGASSYVDGQCVTETFIAAPTADRKGIFAGSASELGKDFLRWVPKDAVTFSAGAFDIQSIYTSLVDALNAYNPDVADMLLGQLGQMEQQVGLSLEKDLFGAFGDKMVSWSMPMAALGTAPEMAILLEVENQESILKTLNTIAAVSEDAFEVDEIERRGIKAYQLRLNLDIDDGGMGFNPLDMFIPTFSFKNGYMVVGLSTGDVKRVFNRMDREDDPSGDIRSNPEFAAYLDRLPESGLNSLSFTDWKAQFEGYYQLLTSMLAFIPMDESIPVDLSLLPDSSTLTEHLCGSVAFGRVDEQGMRTTAIGPWGPETAAIAMGAVAAGVSVFAALMPQADAPFKIR